MTHPAPPLGLIQLAGRQIMPNVLMALPLLKAGRLVRHVVIHTDDTHESQHQASHLVTVLYELAEPDTVDWQMVAVRPGASEVYDAALQEIDSQQPEGEAPTQWVLHATGGTKTMAFGLLMLARHPQVLAVVYRDLGSGQWHQLGLEPDGRPLDRPLQPGDALFALMSAPDSGLDALPLELLMLAQLSFNDPLADPPQGEAQQSSPRHLPPVKSQRVADRPVNVLGWLQAALKYHRGFAATAPPQLQLDATVSEGQAFECWVAHVVYALGARQVQWNFCVNDSHGSNMIEFDVAACHGDRLLVMDLKLDRADKPGKTQELRNAIQTAQWTAGRSVRTVVVRPNWRPTKPVSTTAELLGIAMVWRDTLVQFPVNILRWLGIRATDRQQALARNLSETLARAVEYGQDKHAIFRHWVRPNPAPPGPLAHHPALKQLAAGASTAPEPDPA